MAILKYILSFVNVSFGTQVYLKNISEYFFGLDYVFNDFLLYIILIIFIDFLR